MPSTLFLQSDLQDPYRFYEEMLNQNPVYWDNQHQLWAVYSYQGCKEILDHPSADINPSNKNGLNEYALLITGQLVRLSNGLQHEITRFIVTHLFEQWKQVKISEMVAELLKRENDKHETDWVNLVCKKLPVLVLLKGFDFTHEAVDYIADHMGQLVKIMSPDKTPELSNVINELSEEIYLIAQKHFSNTNGYQSLITCIANRFQIVREKALSFCISNLIGLLIQSYDASRGALSNALFQTLIHEESIPGNPVNKNFLRKSIIETLRYDSPVHYTKRIAVDEILLSDQRILKNETILIVLAAANHDPVKFENANSYDIERANNAESLTFGAGRHACIAEHFVINLVTETLFYLFDRYPKIKLVEKDLQYEPLSNVRLAGRVLISLS